MLVIDRDILRAIYILHLPQEILLHDFFTADAQDVSRNKWAIHKRFTCLDSITLVHPEVLAVGNQVRNLHAGFIPHDDG